MTNLRDIGFGDPENLTRFASEADASQLIPTGDYVWAFTKEFPTSKPADGRGNTKSGTSLQFTIQEGPFKGRKATRHVGIHGYSPVYLAMSRGFIAKLIQACGLQCADSFDPCYGKLIRMSIKLKPANTEKGTDAQNDLGLPHAFDGVGALAKMPVHTAAPVVHQHHASALSPTPTLPAPPTGQPQLQAQMASAAMLPPLPMPPSVALTAGAAAPWNT